MRAGKQHPDPARDISPLKQLEYAVYRDLIVILGKYIFYGLEGD